MSEEMKNNQDNKKEDEKEQKQEENKNEINLEKPSEESKNDKNNNTQIENMPLNSTWIFWYASRKEKDHHIPYGERMTKIAEFNTLQDFFKYYLYLKPVNEIDRNVDIGLFKEGYQPLWESCPDSGCWLLRFKRTADLKEINLKWEKVLFSLISEQFEEPHMLGAVLSIRGRETIIEIWFNYFKYDKIKNMVAVKFGKLILGNQNESESSTTLYFKDNSQSMLDKSTLRNAETYSFKKKRKFTYK
jgi:translation initiation factor 4E